MGVQSNVDAVAVTTAGSGCTTASSVSTTGGSGSGLELNVVASGGAILYVTPSEITDTGYLPGDTVSIVQSGCTGDTLTVKGLQDLDVHSALVTGNVSQDGWIQIEYGFTNGGPYPFTTTTFCTASPSIVFSGGTPTANASAYLLSLNQGSPASQFVVVVYKGQYGSTPTASVVDSCIPHGGVAGTGASATVTMSGSGVSSVSISGGSNYHTAQGSANGTSTNSLTIGTGSQTLTVTGSANIFTVGNVVTIWNNASDYMLGTITAWTQSTGSMTVNVTSVVGSGSFSSWIINGAGNGEYGPNASTGMVRIAIGGLAPSTTVYAVPVYRVDPNASTGQTLGSQFSFTTLAGTTAPVAPVAPLVTWQPTSPANFPAFSTGYTIISLGGTSGDCTAQSNVGPISYGTTTWSVSSGTTLTTILAHPSNGSTSGGMFGYGAIFEFAQGSVCQIPSAQTYYTLPGTLGTDPAASGINDPAHRYVVFRTKQTGTADFPAPGVRFDPNGDNGTWLAHMAQLQSQHPAGTGVDNEPEVLVTDQNNCTTHHWFIYNMELSVNGAGNWGSAAQIGTDNDGIEEACEPQYIVLDRDYFHGPTRVSTTTTMAGGIYGSPGGHFALTNSAFDGYDTNNPQTFDVILSDCTAGPADVENNLFHAASGQGFYVQSDGVSYCGSAPVSSASQTNPTTLDDLTYLRNYHLWSPSTLQQNGAWDGLSRVDARNQFESKGGRRWSVTGNYFNGQWCSQTAGAAISLSSNNVGQFYGTSGDTDVAMSSNVFVNVAVPIQIDGTKGTGQTGPPDNSINRHFSFTNNIGWNLGKNLWKGNPCSGAGPGYFYLDGGPQDVDIENNTLADVNGDIGSSLFAFYPTWLQAGDGVSLTAGFTVKNNVWHMSGGGVSDYGILPNISPACAPGQDCTNFLVSPNLNTSSYPASDLASAYISNGSGGLVTSSYTWSGNIDIGGWYAGSLTPWTQMTQAQINTLSANLPSGDTWITGSTIAARQTAAGFAGIDSGNMNCTATSQNPTCSAGANIATLENAQGIVRNIQVTPGSGLLSFSYTAPDTRPCSVDTSPDNVTWTRTTYSGASSQNQTITVSGLGSNTLYRYSLFCYFDQSSWTSNYGGGFPSESTSIATEGFVSTIGAGSVSPANSIGPAGSVRP